MGIGLSVEQGGGIASSAVAWRGRSAEGVRIRLEQAVECRTADPELAGSLELIAAIQIEDQADVVENNGVEVENLERS